MKNDMQSNKIVIDAESKIRIITPILIALLNFTKDC